MTHLRCALPASLERVARGERSQADDCVAADPLGAEVQVVVDEGLGDGVDAAASAHGIESVDVVRVREPDEDAVVGDADGRDGHRDGFVGERDVSVGLESRLNRKDHVLMSVASCLSNEPGCTLTSSIPIQSMLYTH